MTRFAIPWLSKPHRTRRFVALALMVTGFLSGCGRRSLPPAQAESVPDARGPGYSSGADGSSSVSGIWAGDRGESDDSVNSVRSKFTVPSEVQTVAAMLLGSSAEVLAFGDLAHNGHDQAIVVNRIRPNRGTKDETPAPETRTVPFTRAAVIERDGATWTEVLRCDEHLTNPKGFLLGAPLSPVTGWNIQLGPREKDNSVDVLSFTPLKTQGAASLPSIEVKWNPQVNRYEALDGARQFLGEQGTLEMPTATLK